jgi:hypothetical protein
MKLLYSLAAGCLLLICLNANAGNNAQYEQRRADYVDTALASLTGTKIILQAYKGVPVDTNLLNAKLSNIATGVTSDFDIIELVRILYLQPGVYDSKILPVLYSVPYWVTKGDTVRNYWSENHMIMWMGSDWLLHEKYNKPIDANLRNRLVHYLDLKIQYGYYEFFSSVYTPYCLSGLLNLADFAQDNEIKTKATLASQGLLKELLMLTNDKGVFFPVAGRNYPGKYKTPYGQNHNNLIYLLTGMGEAPKGSSAAGPFLASSDIPVDTVISSWTPVMDTLIHIGHSLDSGFVLNSGMSFVDKVVFQWSSGAYFHPAVVQETVQLLDDSLLWDQVDFALLQPIRSIITPATAPALAESLGCISKSTVISGQSVQIFKHNSITLASVPDFWKGKVGFQQHVCVANVGTTAVYVGSGEVQADWEDRSANHANIHLPYVGQKHNVALLMYRPEFTPALLGATYANKDVALHWQHADFDEEVTDSLWLIGRQQQNYVAVRRYCNGQVNGVDACSMPSANGQAWAIMVGDSAMYGGFNAFKDAVHNAQFTEQWYIDSATSQYVYYAKIQSDTITVDYAWGVDTLLGTGILPVQAQAPIRIAPNPTTGAASIDLTLFAEEPVLLKITSTSGVQMAEISVLDASQPVQINTTGWGRGMYFVNAKTPSGRRGNTKLIKQ